MSFWNSLLSQVKTEFANFLCTSSRQRLWCDQSAHFIACWRSSVHQVISDHLNFVKRKKIKTTVAAYDSVCVWAFVAWRVIKCKWCRVKLTRAARWTKLAAHSKTIWHVTSHMMHFQLCLFKSRPLPYPYTANSKFVSWWCHWRMFRHCRDLAEAISERCPWATQERTGLTQAPKPSKTSTKHMHAVFLKSSVVGWKMH